MRSSYITVSYFMLILGYFQILRFLWASVIRRNYRVMPTRVVEKKCLGALGSSYLANAFPVIFNAEEASYVIIEKAYRMLCLIYKMGFCNIINIPKGPKLVIGNKLCSKILIVTKLVYS